MNNPAAEPSIELLAEQLFSQAITDQQASTRVAANTPVSAIRAEVRTLARCRRVRIRTGLIDDVLVVVRADADVWHESAQTMRDKLAPGD